jgi:hypothetical protein
MGYLCIGLMMILWIGVGISLLVRKRQLRTGQCLDPQTGIGVLVGSITPLVVLFYLLSCIGAPSVAFIMQVAFEEGFSPLVVALLLCFGIFTIGLPLLALLMKWRERTVIDAQGIQFPRFPFRLVRLPWSEITELKVTEHKGPSAQRARVIRYITEVSIHAGDKVYKPTWDASTWKRWRTTILRAIASQAHLTEVEPEHWVRDAAPQTENRNRRWIFAISSILTGFRPTQIKSSPATYATGDAPVTGSRSMAVRGSSSSVKNA